MKKLTLNQNMLGKCRFKFYHINSSSAWKTVRIVLAAEWSLELHIFYNVHVFCIGIEMVWVSRCVVSRVDAKIAEGE